MVSDLRKGPGMAKKNYEALAWEQEYIKLKRENDYYQNQPVARGEFQLLGPVHEDSAHKLINQLDVWKQKHPGEPITITINSQGGVVLDGFALYDYLQRTKAEGHKVTTVGMGLVASMAGVILQAGNERVMTARAWLLVHEVQAITEGSFSAIEDDMRFNKRLQDQVLDVLAERSKWSRKMISTKWKRKDCWLSAEDALKAGFIDRIET